MNAKMMVEEVFNSFDSKIDSMVQSKIIPQIQQLIETEKELFEFELAFSAIVPEEKIIETTKAVKDIRNDDWTTALKKANGDLTKAAVLFSSI